MQKRIILIVLAGLLLIGCGDDDNPAASDGSGLSGLAGTWTLKSWTWTRAAPPGDSTDWVSLMGLAGNLSIRSSGEFIAQPAVPWGFGQDDGMLTVEGDSIYWDGHNDEEWVKFTISSGQLRLEWPELEFTDMDNDGSPEDAWLVVRYVK
jgi:hypothetical protein